MNKIEEIYKLLNDWKASLELKKVESKVGPIEFARGTIFGLELAVGICDEPSNCEYCLYSGLTMPNSNYCKFCGRVLND